MLKALEVITAIIIMEILYYFHQAHVKIIHDYVYLELLTFQLFSSTGINWKTPRTPVNVPSWVFKDTKVKAIKIRSEIVPISHFLLFTDDKYCIFSL